ncbi:MAG TPA: hypothetical protein PKI32_08580, partial [Opitutales bacterium]|nr:hypothetical protein [Opitutales bacterium]
SVAAAFNSSAYLTTDGKLFTFGYNRNGQVGNGTTDNTNVPYEADSSVASMAVGWHDVYYITTGGDLYGCGWNESGQLGLGYACEMKTAPTFIASNVSFVAAGGASALYLTDSYESPYWPCNSVGPKFTTGLGWIDDSYYPWTWSYGMGLWYYVFAGLEDTAVTCGGYWIAYYTPDFTDYGWGYVYPEIGWWCFTSDMTAHWLDFGDPLPIEK